MSRERWAWVLAIIPAIAGWIVASITNVWLPQAPRLMVSDRGELNVFAIALSRELHLVCAVALMSFVVAAIYHHRKPALFGKSLWWLMKQTFSVALSLFGANMFIVVAVSAVASLIR
jgi:hypothetical protein